MDIVGWTDSKISHNRIAVLAETYDGKTIVFLGDLPKRRSSIYLHQMDLNVQLSVQEQIINEGKSISFTEAQQIFPNINKKDYFSNN